MFPGGISREGIFREDNLEAEAQRTLGIKGQFGSL